MSKTHDFSLRHAPHIDTEAGQYGLGCRCGKRSADVVYIVTQPLPPGRHAMTGRTMAGIPAGAYCFTCLADHVRAAGRIPVPMSEDLFDRLRAELTGDSAPGRPLKTMFTAPPIPY